MENYNPPPLKLAFDARATSQIVGVPASGLTQTFVIDSYRGKYINGKLNSTEVLDFTNKVNEETSMSIITQSKEVQGELTHLTIQISANTGSARSGTLILTQEISGKTITIIFNQAAGVTVQDYILLGPLITNFMFLAAGGTETVEVESYILWTDGSKTGALPYIGSKPSWLTVDITAKNQYVGNTKYLVKMTVASNIGAIRNGSLYLDHPSAGGPTIEFTLSQGEQITDTDITLTLRNLPTNGTGALFGEFEVPNNTSSSGYFAFSILNSTHQFTYRRSTGLQVNLSTPGETDTAYVGDIIRLYTWDDTQVKWIYRTQFSLSGRDETIIVTEI